MSVSNIKLLTIKIEQPPKINDEAKVQIEDKPSLKGVQSDHNDQSWKMPEAKILDDLINSNNKNSNSQILSKEKGNEINESINKANNKCSRIHDFKDKNVESSEEETKDSNSPKNSHTPTNSSPGITFHDGITFSSNDIENMSLIVLFEKYFKEYLNEEDSIINQTNAKLLQSNLIMNNQIENGQKISKREIRRQKKLPILTDRHCI